MKDIILPALKVAGIFLIVAPFYVEMGLVGEYGSELFIGLLILSIVESLRTK